MAVVAGPTVLRRHRPVPARRTCPGYEDIDVYPDHTDLERARELAELAARVTRCGPAVLYYGERNDQPGRSSQLITTAAARRSGSTRLCVGLFGGQHLRPRWAYRGAPFDLGIAGWCEDYHDPWDFIQLFDGTTIQDDHNINFSYFNDPVFNERMHAANELVGDPRYEAFAGIETDLERDAAPWAAMAHSERQRSSSPSESAVTLSRTRLRRPRSALPATRDHGRRPRRDRARFRRDKRAHRRAAEQRDG